MLASSFLMHRSQNSLISEFWDFLVGRRGVVIFLERVKISSSNKKKTGNYDTIIKI